MGKSAPKKAIAKKPAKAKASKGKAAKGKASKGKKDDKPKVKRAPGPYMIFCKAERPKIVKANPNMPFGEVGKALGAAWGKLSTPRRPSTSRPLADGSLEGPRSPLPRLEMRQDAWL